MHVGTIDNTIKHQTNIYIFFPCDFYRFSEYVRIIDILKLFVSYSLEPRTTLLVLIFFQVRGNFLYH